MDFTAGSCDKSVVNVGWISLQGPNITGRLVWWVQCGGGARLELALAKREGGLSVVWLFPTCACIFTLLVCLCFVRVCMVHKGVAVCGLLC